MNIVIINGQNHKGSTWNIGNLLVQKLDGENEIAEYFLPRDLNHFCMGCYACVEERARCPYWQDKLPILRDMKAADLIIFTSPNYCMMPSAPMKAFLDLFFTNWMSHKPIKEMFSKRAVVISSTAGMGAAKTVKLIANNLTNWGIPKIYTYASVVNAMSWDMVPQKKKVNIEKDMEKLAKKLSHQGKVSVGIKTRILFWFYGGMQKANWGASKAEKQYWVENGWLSGSKPWKKNGNAVENENKEH